MTTSIVASLFHSQHLEFTGTQRLVAPLPVQLLDKNCLCAGFSTGLQKLTSSAGGSKGFVIVTALLTAAVAALICVCEFKPLWRHRSIDISLCCPHTSYTVTICPTWILCFFISNLNKKPLITSIPREFSITWKMRTQIWKVSWSILCLMLQETVFLKEKVLIFF